MSYYGRRLCARGGYIYPTSRAQVKGARTCDCLQQTATCEAVSMQERLSAFCWNECLAGENKTTILLPFKEQGVSDGQETAGLLAKAAAVGLLSQHGHCGTCML